MPCSHHCWLSITAQDQGANGLSFVEYDRLNQITNELDQCPSLVTFAGVVDPLLLEEFGIKQQRLIGPEVHLYRSSYTPTYPLLIANVPTPEGGISTLSLAKCHRSKKRQTPFLDSTAAFQGLFSHILLPLSDLLCYSIRDLDDLKDLAGILRAWLPYESRIRGATLTIILLVSNPLYPDDDYRQALLKHLNAASSRSLLDIVRVSVAHFIPEEHTPFQSTIKDEVLSTIKTIRRRRRDDYQLLSLKHFSALARYACDQLSQDPQNPFEMIGAARTQYPVATDLDQHIHRFLGHMQSLNDLLSFGVPIIASSFLLDSFPPGSHIFKPQDVFETCYQTPLVLGSNHLIKFPGSTETLLQSNLVELVEDLFSKLSRKLSYSRQTSAQIHAGNLLHFHSRLSKISEKSTCLGCLRRRPQYKLPCDHYICENCVVVFGQEIKEDEGCFTFQSCFICQAEMPALLRFKTHPPTAGASILSIDGGGARGILPLKFLKLIEQEIGLQMPIQRFFKLAFGISSGALITLGLFLNGWSIDKCMEKFEDLSKLAFTRRKVISLPFLSRLHELLASWLDDSIYPAKHIEQALRAAFGDRAILENSYATSIGTKIGLPVATVQEESVCLFTNYNGAGNRKSQIEYHIIGPEDMGSDVKVARSASAAVAFFPPKDVHGVGTFQDVGPLINDPIITATSEASALFPLLEQPDFLLSLGTGVSQAHVKGAATLMTKKRNKWYNRALPRMWRMVWKRMSDRPIKQLLSSNPRYHRLDVVFETSEPRLDDISSIAVMKSRLDRDHSEHPTVKSVARFAIASLFYFELDEAPILYDGAYNGWGHIRCSVKGKESAFHSLISKLSSCSAVFYLNDRPLLGLTPGRTKDGFAKAVKLKAPGKFSITLQLGKEEPCHISGSPFTVERLSQAQQLYAPFGRADHCSKRGREVQDERRTKKRRRIV